MARPGAHRKFYDFTKSDVKEKGREEPNTSPQDLIAYVSDNVIGAATVFSTPFGPRRVVYCDYIASGRSVKFIEDYIGSEVLPQYGSTHTTSTVTALQTTLFRHEARDIIRNATQASEHDRVLFVGSGATAAVQKLIHGLKLTGAPVVFVDPYAHHSTLLPWREIGAKVLRIRETRQGDIDSEHLEELLKQHEGESCRLIGCLTAASNVTGVVADDVKLTKLLHKYGALAFWDYATAAPYVDVKMNPLVSGDGRGEAHKDAIYFSMHKFLGGVQTPGILIAKKNLFENSVPEVCGGGSVFFVSRDSHRYLQDVETREEGGTPAIVESIRAGLVMQLKNAISPDYIAARNTHLSRKLSELMKSVAELKVLGNVDSPNRLPILSFVVRHPQSGLLLHHNFICAVLNDVFGIQARGGCACAGPYAQDLLGIDEVLAQRYEKLLVEDNRLDRSHLRRQREHSDVEVLRPGFVRLNLPYSASDEQIEFILSAVQEVCKNGWRLLPQYNFNPETGEWKHHTNLVYRERLWLQNISYAEGVFSYQNKDSCGDALNYMDCLEKASEIMNQAAKASQRRQVPDDTIIFRDEAAELRWFLLPSEAKEILQHNSIPFRPHKSYPHPPFLPLVYPLKDSDLRLRSDFVWQPTSGAQCCIKRTKMSEKTSNSVKKNENDEGITRVLPENGIERECDMKTGDTHSDLLEINRTDVGRNIELANEKCKEGIHSSQRTIFEGLEGIITGKDSDVISSNEESKNMYCKSSLMSVGALERAISQDKETDELTGTDGEVTVPSKDSVNTSKKKTGEVTANDGEVTIPSKDSVITSKKKTGEVTANDGEVTIPSKDSVITSKKKTGEVTANDGEVTIPSKDSVNTSKKKSQIVCEDLKCFIKRDDNRPCECVPVRNKWHPPPKNIFNPTVEALLEFDMVRDGDRVLVCLSGGKDSLSLLHTLRQYQFYAGARGLKFTLGAVTVDPMSASYDPRPLIPYLASLGVPYFFEQQDILKQAAGLENLNSICSFCSRMKRGRIYATARREGYNVLAFGQHLDDLTESFIMSIFHNGRLRTMKAHYSVKEGDLRVVRPFAYVREKDLRRFAEYKKLPVIPENCPACFEAPKERHRVKQMLAQQEVLFPGLYWSLRTALHPVMAINLTGMENAIFGKNGTLESLSKVNGCVQNDEEE
ncbi:uncharacterized protein LOC121860608 isoform X1 [Homarus americanus]|nr:uncharacterized protein LOC121860608 isoform X1 [Homarus americanus]XP_042213744.1 uncharacterized protein LOC121860608 isoform X1 [Homarus americanus]